MTVELPLLPPRIARLPKDERGYPVPWFVAWFKDGEEQPRGVGEPDFRILFHRSRETAVQRRLCWVCGERMGVHQVFVIGPMCSINRTSMEPPLHRDCAEFTAKACPFLTRPRQKRDKKGLPADRHVDGKMIERNPGAVALWESGYAVWRPEPDQWLIRLGEPTRVDWWAEGRQATRAEIQASIDSGYPLLLEPALQEGQEAVDELARLTRRALKLLPAA